MNKPALILYTVPCMAAIAGIWLHGSLEEGYVNWMLYLGLLMTATVGLLRNMPVNNKKEQDNRDTLLSGINGLAAAFIVFGFGMAQFE